MNEITSEKTVVDGALDGSIALRILDEGYGPGAWHGADMRAALASTTAEEAFRRPAPGRHNIAEIAVHHAACIHGVIAQLTGKSEPEFPLDGSDWYELSDARPLSWTKIQSLVGEKHRRLADVLRAIDAGELASPLGGVERMELALGVTCHAVYHAGQVQLVRVLNG